MKIVSFVMALIIESLRSTWITKFVSTLCLVGLTPLVLAQTSAAIPPMPKELQGKVITLMIPFPPGGETDTTQRFLASQIKKLANIDIVVINKPGANAALAAQELANSRQDGLTLLGHDNSSSVMHPATNFGPAPDRRSLAPISVLTLTPLFMYVGADSPIKTVNDVISKARTDSKFTVGVGNIHTQMANHQFYHGLGITPYTVTFRGPAEMGIAASQGSINVFMSTATSGQALVSAGKLRAIGVGWKQSLPVYPDAVPLSNFVRGYAAYNFQQVSAPSGTPRHILEYYNQLWRAAASSSESAQRWKDLSVIHLDLDIPQSERFLEQEYQQALKSIRNIPNLSR